MATQMSDIVLQDQVQKLPILVVTLDIVQRWQQVGKAHGFSTDADIASFLLQHYENSWIHLQTGGGHCANCGKPFPLLCGDCQPHDEDYNFIRDQFYPIGSDDIHAQCSLSAAESDLFWGNIPTDGAVTQNENTQKANGDVAVSGLEQAENKHGRGKQSQATEGIMAIKHLQDSGQDFVGIPSHDSLVTDYIIRGHQCGGLFTANPPQDTSQRTMFPQSDDCHLTDDGISDPQWSNGHVTALVQSHDCQTADDIKRPSQPNQQENSQHSSSIQLCPCVLDEPGLLNTDTTSAFSRTSERLPENNKWPLTIEGFTVQDNFTDDALAQSGEKCDFRLRDHTDCDLFSLSDSSANHLTDNANNFITVSSDSVTMNSFNEVDTDQPPDLTKKEHLCPYCGSTFSQLGALNVHIRKHKGEKPFVCKECEASFAVKDILIAHMRKHSGEKPFLCQQCGAAYAQASNLTTHMRTHSGEKPFKCTWCGFCFSTSSSLTRHVRTHTGQKPYRCSLCNVGFITSASLKEHTQKHTGVTLFNCELCGAGFTKSSRLRRHQKNVKCIKY